MRLANLVGPILNPAQQGHWKSSVRPGTSHLLLVADQFEELYVLCPNLFTRHAFLDLLLPSSCACTQSALPMTLLLSLRADFTAQALALAVEANRLPDPPPQARLMLADAAYAPGTRRIFSGHDGPVEDVAIIPGEGRALSASADGTLVLWDLGTGERMRRFRGHGDAAHAVVVLPGRDRAVSADRTLILWELGSGDILHRFRRHSAAVRDLAISPDGSTALSASADHTLILWHIETGEVIRCYRGHEDTVLSVAISPEGDTALSGSADGSVILWDLQSGEIRHHMSGVADTVTGSQQATGHYDSVWDLAFLPDGLSAVCVPGRTRHLVGPGDRASGPAFRCRHWPL